MIKSFLVLFFKKEPLSASATPYALRIGLLVLTGLRLAVAARAPLSADEAYYWVWSKALAPGYLDHPPMVAVWIRVGTAIGGDTELGVRLLGPVAALLGSLLLLRAARDFAPSRPNAGTMAVLLLNATLALNVGAVIMTPDTPLLFFWTAALFALGRLVRSGRAGWWLAVGLAAGLALDSKYTASLLGLAVVVWLLLVPQARRWWRCWQLWAGGAVALALFAPVLGWNAAHDWASFAKQAGRTGDFLPGLALQHLAELLGGQLGLATPGVAAVFLAGCVTCARAGWRRHPAPALLACVTLLPGLVFLQHALGDRVQANWPVVIFPGAALAAAWAGTRFWRPAVALGVAMSALVCLQAAAAPLALPRMLDFTLIRLAGWSDLAGAVFVAQMREKAAYVAADQYGLAAELAFRLHTRVVGAEWRWGLFALPKAGLAGQTGILVRSAREGAPDGRAWGAMVKLGSVTRGRRGQLAETYELYRVRDPRAVVVDLPQSTARVKKGFLF